MEADTYSESKIKSRTVRDARDHGEPYTHNPQPRASYWLTAYHFKVIWHSRWGFSYLQHPSSTLMWKWRLFPLLQEISALCVLKTGSGRRMYTSSAIVWWGRSVAGLTLHTRDTHSITLSATFCCGWGCVVWLGRVSSVPRSILLKKHNMPTT